MHPLLHPESSVKPEILPRTFKFAREDTRRMELDEFIASRMADELPRQKQIREYSARAGLPDANVSVFEGHTISLLLQMMNARRGVELGTLGGYSTSWICRAIEKHAGAHVDSCEMSPKYAEV